MIFAERLKALREAAGISAYELAKRSGVSKQALSKLESGQRQPAWETVQKLAAALGVSCAEFEEAKAPPTKKTAAKKRKGK